MASKKVFCHETGEEFKNCGAAGLKYGVSSETIRGVLDNPNRIAAGYHWSRTKDFFVGKPLSGGYVVISNAIINYTTNVEYPGIRAAARAYGIDHNSIRKALDKPNLSAAGCKWCTDVAKFEKLIEDLGTDKNYGLPIFCYELKLWFKSREAAAEFCGLKSTTRLIQAINKPDKMSGGYHWCETENYFDNIILTGGSKTTVSCYETKKSYESKKEAELDIDCTILAHVIDNPYLTAGGYHWCTDLNNYTPISVDGSIAEGQIRTIVESLGVFCRKDKQLLNGKEIDIFIPDLMVGIEYNGNYWHSEEVMIKASKPITYHQDKTLLSKDKGIQLIQIFEHQWLEKSEIFKSVIANKLGFSDKIYARKCKVVELKDCKEFLETNHLQGNCPSSTKLGLTYNDELVSLMTFGKPRFNKSYEYELIRFCNKLNTSVVGGASKLLKYFETKYKPKSLVSYANLQWSDGGLYNQLGFTYSDTSTPNYWWIRNNKLLNRYQCQKHKLKDLLGDKFNPDLSEKANMENNGYSRLFDCGNIIFTKEYK